MKSIKIQFAVTIVCIVLGLMIAYQFKAVKHTSMAGSGGRYDEVSNQLKWAKSAKESLEADIEKNESEIAKFEEGVASNSSIVNSLKNHLNSIKVQAGVTDVTGPGIMIVLSPPQQSLDNKELVPITNQHLFIIVNELNSYGAEAIMIKNQRITTTTQIRQTGNAIVINDVQYSKLDNFEIAAIGNPANLEYAMSMAGGIRDELYLDGITLKTQKSNNITIFKYNKIVDFKIAKPEK